MFRLYINETDHGTFEAITDVFAYIEAEINSGDLNAKLMVISIVS